MQPQNHTWYYGYVIAIPGNVSAVQGTGVKGSWLGRAGVIVLLKGDTSGLRRALAILQG